MAKQGGAIERAPSAISISQQKVRVDFVFHLKDSTSLYSVEMERGAALKDAVHTLPLQFKFKEGEIGSWVEEIEGMGEFHPDGKKTGYGWQFYINRNGEAGLPYIVNDTAYFPGMDDFKVNTNLKVEWKYECYECDIDCKLLAAQTKETKEDFHLFKGEEYAEDTSISKPNEVWVEKTGGAANNNVSSRSESEIRLNHSLSFIVELSGPEQPMMKGPADEIFDYISVSGGSQVNFIPRETPGFVTEKNEVKQRSGFIQSVSTNISEEKAMKSPINFQINSAKRFLTLISAAIQRNALNISMKIKVIGAQLRSETMKLVACIKTAVEAAVRNVAKAVAYIKTNVIRIAKLILIPVVKKGPERPKAILSSETKASLTVQSFIKSQMLRLSLLLGLNEGRNKQKTTTQMNTDIKPTIFSMRRAYGTTYLLAGAAALAVIIVVATRMV